MGGDGEAPATPAWWPAGGINRPPSPPAWWPEGGINPPARGGDARTVGRDGGPNREDDDGEESLAAESHVRWPEEKTSPSPRRTSSDADPLGAPVVVRNTSGTRVSPAENDRATDRGPPSRRPAAFDPLENLSDAWRFIRGDDFSSLAGMDEDTFRLADAFGEHGGGDALTAAVDDRKTAGGSTELLSTELLVSKRRDEDRAGSFFRGEATFSRLTKRREKKRERERAETTRGRVRRRKRPTNTRASSENPPRRLARRPFRRSTGAGSATCTRR